MSHTMRNAAVSVSIALLAACGGGGGGGGVVTPVEVPFTSFAAIGPNQTVQLNAVVATAAVATTLGDVTSAGLHPIRDSSVRLTYDGSGALSAISIPAPLGPVPSELGASFDRNTLGHSIDCSDSVCLAENPTSSALFVDAAAAGWNYQSFGVWRNMLLSSGTAWTLGVVSAGRVTPGTAVPTIGNANFAGLAVGFYIDTAGGLFGTTSPINLGVNFGMQTIAYTTVETNLVDSRTGAESSNPGLNISGTLSYAQGSSAFSGTLQTSNGQLSGPGRGSFYGPEAEEIGGTYALQGSGVSRMLGAFGGKR